MKMTPRAMWNREMEMMSVLEVMMAMAAVLVEE